MPIFDLKLTNSLVFQFAVWKPKKVLHVKKFIFTCACQTQQKNSFNFVNFISTLLLSCDAFALQPKVITNIV